MTTQTDAIHTMLSVLKDHGLLRSVNDGADGATLTFGDHVEADDVQLGRRGELLADAALSWQAMEAELA